MSNSFEEVMQRFAASSSCPLGVAELEALHPLLSSFSLSLELAKSQMAKGAMREAVRISGGPSNLGREVGVSRQSVNNWCARGAPAARCDDIAKATGVKKNLLLPVKKTVAKPAPAAGVPTGEGRL